MNNLDMLHQIGWINQNEFLWWNFNYPKEERRFIKNIDEFMSSFEEVGEIGGKKLFVTPTNYIPITKLSLNINKEIVDFMITARPLTPAEINQYFNDDNHIHGLLKHNRNYLDESERSLESKLLIEELKRNVSKGSRDLPNHFFPHIRGIIREINEESIFYHELYKEVRLSKDSLYDLINSALNKNDLGFIELIRETYLTHTPDEAILKSLRYCKNENLIYVASSKRGSKIRKPEQIHDKFSYVTYDEIKHADGLRYTYYPALIEGYREAIPFFICNNAHGKKGLFNLGVYRRKEFYPISDKDLLMKSSEKLSTVFEEKVTPVYFEKKNGNLKPTIIE